MKARYRYHEVCTANTKDVDSQHVRVKNKLVTSNIGKFDQMTRKVAK